MTAEFHMDNMRLRKYTSDVMQRITRTARLLSNYQLKQIFTGRLATWRGAAAKKSPGESPGPAVEG
jgi:hypothetical protein